MRRTLVWAALVPAVVGSVHGTPSATASPLPAPPYVSRAVWTHTGRLSSLRVYPTRAGRAASVAPNGDAAAAQATSAAALAAASEAWSEVLTLAPDAASPTMYAQFMCHWRFAEFAQPGKVSWNLEPWRPEVSDDAMVGAGCNPGGAEESF